MDEHAAKLKKLLQITVKSGASDLHLSVGHPPLLRVTRTLLAMEEEKVLTSEDTQNLAFALMTEPQKEKLMQNREVDFAYEFSDQARFRVNIYFQMRKISVALRHIPAKIKTIAELNLPEILHKFSQVGQGFVLLTGATSQGKSTTMAAILDEVNHTRRDHIITIEDPIEYVFDDDQSFIDQREVFQDTLSFSNALRAALREDPDVIMVGEMRDLETISTAITAAETGHLVLATLHTNSASQTLHRLIDVFPPHQQAQISAQLASSLFGVISQRLVPRIKGGFTPACEIMINNSAVANLIREKKIHEIPAVIETSADIGMITFNASLAKLVKKKEVAIESALHYSLNPDDLKSRLSGRSSD